jgi:hypothetical protein
LACRLSKETDSIVIVHIPTLRLADLHPNQQHYGQTNHRQEQACISLQQFQIMEKAMFKRKDEIVNLYRNLGYNILCGKSLDFVTYAQHVMDLYSSSNALKREAFEVLGTETNQHPFDR